MSDLADHLREIRAQLEAATATLHAISAHLDEIEATDRLDPIDRAILEATAADAKGRAEKAEAAVATIAATYPELGAE